MATIHGKLLSAKNRKPLADLRIEAWSADPRKPRRLGNAVSADDGTFTIDITAPAPAVVFRVLRGDELVLDTSGEVQWNERDNSKPILIAVPLETSEEASSVRSAAGVVTNERGVAAPGLDVQLWDRNVGGAQMIAAGRTEADGSYSIAYDPAQLEGKDRADLEIRVVDPRRDGAELARSAVVYQAGDRTVRDLVVERADFDRTPEYERLRGAIDPLLGARSLDAVDADGVTYLAERTGWDARAVAMAAQAAHLAGSSEIPVAHYYALLRSGASGARTDVAQLRDDQVAGALKSAVDQGLIADDGLIDKTVDAHRSQALETLRELRAPGAVSTLGDMLSIALDAGAQARFLEVYRAAGDDAEALWKGLEEAAFDDKTVAGLRSAAALGRLTMQNAPVVKQLREQGVAGLGDLAEQGFYEPRRWVKLIGDAVPEGLTREKYAALLAAQVDITSPTLIAADLVRRGAVDLDGSSEEVAGFLARSHGTHTIGREPVKTWDGFAELSEASKSAAQKLERLYQISPSNASMSALSKIGIGSALEVASYSQAAFLAKHGEAFPSEAQALRVHQKATQVHSTTLNMATMYLAGRSQPNIYALTGKTAKEARTTPDVVAGATLEALFQNMDYCSCKECESIFSPAAYLVELLEFLDVSDEPHTGSNPIDVLLGRRPDLQHLLLSCENTNVALPYVDIVNEVLEHYVVHGNLTGFTGHDTSAESESADLLADPQFVEAAAYDTTKAAVFPWSLPFDMPLAAMRGIFGVFDTTLADALEAFGDADGAARERLGLGPAEYAILTDAGFRELPEYFGEPAGTSIDGLNDAVANAKVFCERTGISYEDLAALLETRFVNPAIGLVGTLQLLRTPLLRIQQFFDGTLAEADLLLLFPENLDLAAFDGDPIAWLTANREAIMGLITLTDVSAEPVECDFAAVELRYALPDPTQNRLDEIAYIRLQRFIRLWRKLGRPIELVDDLLAAFLQPGAAELDTGNVDAAFTALLARVGAFERLRAELAISDGKLPDWLALWEPGASDPVRHDRLALLLRIGTTDLTHLIELSGVDPFADDMDAAEPSMLRFVRLWRAVKASPLKVADLDHLLRSQDATGKLTPSQEEQLRDVKTLRDALTAVEAELGAAVANPDLSHARARAALVYDAAVVDRLFAFVGHSATYSAPFASIEETLPDPLAAIDAALELDPFGHRLTYTGLLGLATQAALDAAADGLALGDVEQIATQAELDAFVSSFKQVVQELRDAGEADLAAFAAEYPELGQLVTDVEALPDPPDKAIAILEAILPDLRAELKRRAVRTSLETITKGDAAVVEAITSGPGVLEADGDPTAGVLDDLLGLEALPELGGDGTYDLLLDPAASEEFVLYVAAPAGTNVTLALDGTDVIPSAAVGPQGEIASTVPITLQAGSLRALRLTLAGLPAGANARLRWRAKSIARSDVPATRLYDAAAVATARASLLRIRKTVMLQRALELTAGELAHLAAVEASTRGVLSALDTDGSIATAALHAQLGRVERLIWFAQLKADHEPDPETMLSLLVDPAQATPQGMLRLAAVMEWDEASLTAVLGRLSLALGEETSLDDLRTVADAMELVTSTLQPAADLIAWADAEPDAALVTAAKASIRERMTDAAWRETIQPASDALRNQRRDALVAYILFHHPPAPEITTPDRLYEHFLLDVQMDACMATSRIRLALSTVQQFVNRCLMGLEANVSPASIRADRWEWMQRYRLWEANRRVFVFPENWLEPELRDGVSPFFRDLQAALLKADITDELAEEAYLAYLKELDGVAKLEIVAAFLDQRKTNDTDDDVLHLFGRTNGKTRQYYSRRFEYGYWTPWEKLPLNVEGDLLLPVVWRSELFLFWITELAKPEGGDRSESPRTIADQGWGSNALTTTELTFSWGEFYNGKWTSPKSTEMGAPLRIVGLDSYDSSQLVVSYRTERPNPDVSERLIFSVLYLGSGAAAYTVTFTSKHAPPLIVPTEDWEETFDPVKAFNYKLLWAPESDATLAWNSLRVPDRGFDVEVEAPGGSGSPRSERVLTQGAPLIGGFRIRPVMHPVQNQWEAPLVYSDEHSTFVLEPEELVWDASWLEIFYEPAPHVTLDIDDIPQVFEEPVIPDRGDPVINPWVDIVNPNFKTIIKGGEDFHFGDAVFNARGRVMPTADAIGGH